MHFNKLFRQLIFLSINESLFLGNIREKTGWPVAIAAGYQEVFDVTVTKDPVRVYLRKEPATSH